LPAIDPAAQPRLFREISAIAEEFHEPMPASVYLMLEPNAWVGQRGGMLGFGSRRVMALGFPLLSDEEHTVLEKYGVWAEKTNYGRKYMGIVRYNAFEGVAGQQSYSLCILDENKTGILISNLVGTNFSRGYAVDIKNGEPSRPLGDEEGAAVKEAMKNGN
jgi:hypothetical protein